MLLKILKSLYWVPVLGVLLREALEGPDEAKYLFLGNLVMAVLLAVIFFGFPAFIVIMLTAVAVMFVIIFGNGGGKLDHGSGGIGPLRAE
jgi:hypothetical protein